MKSITITASPTLDGQAAAPTSATLALADEIGKGVLLDGTARWRAGMSWYKPARVQLLAAPPGESDAPSWSALVVDGVTVPYDEVVGVRMDESALEFIVEQDHSPRQHLRMSTRSEFNLWREALYPKLTSSTLQSTPAESKPSAVYTAQKWLKHADDAATSA